MIIMMNKTFYMRLNDDDRMAARIDVPTPGIDEIMGGSHCEQRLELVDRSMAEPGIDKEHDAFTRICAAMG